MSDLDTLLAERDISRALGRFARIIDAKDWRSLPEIFAEDVRFDYGSGSEQEGIAALAAQMKRFLDPCGPTQHMIGSILVEVTANKALSRAYVQARHQRRDQPAGPVFDSCGDYVDRWERRSAGWRIVRRDAVWLLHSGDPAILAADQGDLG